MNSFVTQALFQKIQSDMSEQKKKWQKFYDLLNAETKPKNFRNYWSFFMALIMLYGAF